MSEPKLYYKNYVSADDTITVNYGTPTRNKLYDRDTASKYLTSGAALDATTVTVEVAFYEGTVAISRAIDTLMLITHNLKTWVYEYWNGSAWVNLYTGTSDTSTTRVVSHSQVTCSKVRLTITGTQVVNAEKYIGEMIVTKLVLDVGQDFSNYKPAYRTRYKELMLGDGSITRAFIRATPNRLQRYGAKCTLKFLTDATLATLYALKETGDPFLWYPESAYRPTEVFYVHWYNDWDAAYSHASFKGAGWDVNMELREV